MRGLKIRSLALLLGLLATYVAFAGTVRTVLVNNEAMAPVYLKMGKSTVLRFAEKPKKVVVGNQNYYGLEFIENDVAIQPLGSIATNLFVYTEHHTYGFLLTPGSRYDDLVFVRWKFPAPGAPKSEKIHVSHVVNLNLAFKLGDNIKVTVNGLQGPSTFGLHFVDCTLENIGKTEVSIAGVALEAAMDGKALKSQNAVIERNKLKPGEKTKARIVLKLEQKADISVVGRYGKTTGQVLIGRKYL